MERVVKVALRYLFLTFTTLKTSTTHYNHLCHIVPFSLTHNDTISNGIALCPNLHRAFDRGLITIDGGYRVKVSAGVIENAGHPYSLKQFNGMAIHLPADRRYYPDPVNLEWHGGNMVKG